MNIETLQHYIDEFNCSLIDNGFKRDLDDFCSSLPASQQNILALREIAEKVSASLNHIFSGDIPQWLRVLLPSADSPPFTEGEHNENLKELIENKEITLAGFYNQLTQHLSVLQSQLEKNISEIKKIEAFINPYIEKDLELLAEENNAVISIVFNEKKTISNLSQFSKSVATWNRALPIYHQLIKSDPPEDIHLVEIQNGSIDLVVNVNVDVALDLAELFKVGFKVFVAYLTYKKMLKPIIESFHGNAKLIEKEEEREALMLENIGVAIAKEIREQHKQAKKIDKKIDGNSLDKKIEVITNLVTSHIVQGNDLRILALPMTDEDKHDQSVDMEQLHKYSTAARLQLRQIPEDSQQKLLEVYGKSRDIEIAE